MKLRPFRIERWFAENEPKSRINIAESCARPLRLGELGRIVGGDGIALDSVRLGYVEPAGNPQLRARIASLYPGAMLENVLVTVGAIEANFLALLSLCEPGDRVVSVVPTYGQLFETPHAQGALVSHWELKAEDGWRPDLGRLAELLASKPKMLIINFPNNPTGTALTQSELAEIARLCDDNGTILYSDEVYRGLNLGWNPPQGTAWSAGIGLRVVVSSLSKAFGLPGLRLGWLVGPKWLIDRASSYRDYTSICSPALSEALAIVALDHREAILSLQKAHAQTNLRLVEEAVARTNEKGEGLSWTAPAEGVVGFLRLPGGLPAWKAGEELVERFGTLVVPGDCFYPLPDTEDKEGRSQQSSHFRLGFGYESDSLEAGLRAIEQYIDTKRAG